MAHKPWFDKGLRFECQKCGRCCWQRGAHTYVYLTEADLAALAAELGLSSALVLERFGEHVDGRMTLRRDTPRCVFQDESGACTVYAARPHQCRSWPFWRENLERERWEREVVALCPGVGRGALVPADEIERIARTDERWYGRS